MIGVEQDLPEVYVPNEASTKRRTRVWRQRDVDERMVLIALPVLSPQFLSRRRFSRLNFSVNQVFFDLVRHFPLIFQSRDLLVSGLNGDRYDIDIPKRLSLFERVATNRKAYFRWSGFISARMSAIHETHHSSLGGSSKPRCPTMKARLVKGRTPVDLAKKNNSWRMACVLALALSGFSALVPVDAVAQGADGVLPLRGGAPDHDGVGNVYTMTNGVRNDAVVVFRRGANGRLEEVGKVRTGGRGTGGLRENQGSLILSQGNRWLFAANPCSDEISVFEVREGGRLKLVDVVRSGGDRPISLTVSQDLLYVLNAGSSGNITAFRVGPSGHLTPLTDSTRPLSTTASAPCPAMVADRGDPHAMCSIAGPTTIGFDPNGGVLVVTERITSEIDTWTIGDDGRATRAAIVSQPAHSTPFGFDFAQRGRMVVADSFLDLPGLGAASSFILSPNGHLTSKSTGLGSGNTSLCWTIITNDGHVAFVTNPASQAVSSYRILSDGSLSLLNAKAGVLTGGDPRDPALSEDGRFFYVLNNKAAVISGFRVNDDGSLKLLDFDAGQGFPSGANGLAAY